MGKETDQEKLDRLEREMKKDTPASYFVNEFDLDWLFEKAQSAIKIEEILDRLRNGIRKEHT